MASEYFILALLMCMTTLVRLYISHRSSAMSHQESPPGQPLSTADQLEPSGVAVGRETNHSSSVADSPSAVGGCADHSHPSAEQLATQNPANSNLLPNKLPQTLETQENG